MKYSILLFPLFLSCLAVAQHVPSFEEVISLRAVTAVNISPDGKHVAFSVQTTDWNENRYDNEIWISKNGKKPFQLTNSPRSNSAKPAFSPDGNWIAFLADRGSKNQIYVMRLEGGEAQQVTKEEEGIISFEWHPSGKKFIILKPDRDEKEKKEKERRYGSFEQDDKDYTMSHLWQVAFEPGMADPSEFPCFEKTDSLKALVGCIEWPKSQQITSGLFTVVGFIVSPDGEKIAFTRQPNSLINSFLQSDIYVTDISSKKITPVITNIGPDGLEDWSPDSKEILYTTNLSDSISSFYTNSKLYAINLRSKVSRQLAKDVDEDLGGFVWRTSGIYSAIWNKTRRPIYKIDPQSGKHVVFLNSPEQIYTISFSRSGDRFAFTGRNGDHLTEAYIANTAAPKPEKLSELSTQIAGWKVAQSEIISWKSTDGTQVEGILHKPKDYDPSRKYPLMVVLHGGPTGIDTPTPVPGYVYPLVQWLDKGSLVLRINYRGSAGYGEAFRSLNVRNLGIGDTWDVLSAVDYLDSKGIIDRERMGCMGWSQGGFISAFLTTHTDIFRAVSVGAGITNWVTYYAGTDIHPFTLQYLQATPWVDAEIYRKTSPMANIRNARTPTLIQHGEFDKRVPIANAYELLQGLRDNGVKCDLIIYKGFGHGITKPRERLAATWHNWQWFNKYIWDEEAQMPLGN